MKAAKTFCINKLKTNSFILLDHSASRSAAVVAAALVTVVVVVADVEVLLPFLLVMLQCF